MNNLHIENSYNIWKISIMKQIIATMCYKQYRTIDVKSVLNKSYSFLYIEWWLHNIGYYLTLLFCNNEKILKLNNRFKHVDLNERKVKDEIYK